MPRRRDVERRGHGILSEQNPTPFIRWTRPVSTSSCNRGSHLCILKTSYALSTLNLPATILPKHGFSTCRLLFVLVILAHERRRVVHVEFLETQRQPRFSERRLGRR